MGARIGGRQDSASPSIQRWSIYLMGFRLMTDPESHGMGPMSPDEPLRGKLTRGTRSIWRRLIALLLHGVIRIVQSCSHAGAS